MERFCRGSIASENRSRFKSDAKAMLPTLTPAERKKCLLVIPQLVSSSQIHNHFSQGFGSEPLKNVAGADHTTPTILRGAPMVPLPYVRVRAQKSPSIINTRRSVFRFRYSRVTASSRLSKAFVTMIQAGKSV